jgi:RimJ/RimL family protein N-acetyltransferase
VTFPNLELVADGVGLRPFRPNDVVALVDACNDEELQRRLPLPRPYTREHAETWCRHGAEDLRTGGEGLHLAVVDPAGDALLGNVSLKKTQWARGITELGYWTVPAARGKGVASAAARLLGRWALTHEKIFRVELTTAPDNVASRRVAENAGFVFEGIARCAGYTHFGRTDLLMHSLIRSDVEAESLPGSR